MRPSEIIETHREVIGKLVADHNGMAVRVFGSAATGTDTESSDLDLLVEPGPAMTLLDLGALRHDLTTRLGIPVDILTPNALHGAFRTAVLKTARPL